MNLIRKSSPVVSGMIAAVVMLVATSAWQFYQFVSYKNAEGLLEVQGGTLHLWLAIGLGLTACGVAFFVFSLYARYDESNELHINF